MIGFKVSGSFDRTEHFLTKVFRHDIYSTLEHYGRDGVSALSLATPVNTGDTAAHWTYEIVRDKSSWSIIWDNTHVVDGRPIAILLQYGHATKNGGFVHGRDYINPALRPIFDQIAADAWKAVTT